LIRHDSNRTVERSQFLLSILPPRLILHTLSLTCRSGLLHLYSILHYYHTIRSRTVRFSIRPSFPSKGIGRFFLTSTTLPTYSYPPAVYRYQSRIHPQIYEDCFQTSKHSSIIQLIDSRESIFTLTKVHRFQNTPVARLHASMNSYGQKRQRLEYGNDLSGTTEHSQHYVGNVNGFTTTHAHPATFEHQAIPYSSAGEEVVSAGAGAVFVPQFVVSSAEGSLGLATHQSSMPIVYTQASPQPAILLNGLHSHPQGMRPISRVLERIQTKQRNFNGETSEPGYFRGHGEPVMTPLPGFPSLLSYEDTENRYVTKSFLSMAFQNTRQRSSHSSH